MQHTHPELAMLVLFDFLDVIKDQLLPEPICTALTISFSESAPEMNVIKALNDLASTHPNHYTNAKRLFAFFEAALWYRDVNGVTEKKIANIMGSHMMVDFFNKRPSKQEGEQRLGIIEAMVSPRLSGKIWGAFGRWFNPETLCIVKTLIKHVRGEKDFLATEGLFRLSGSLGRIQGLLAKIGEVNPARSDSLPAPQFCPPVALTVEDLSALETNDILGAIKALIRDHTLYRLFPPIQTAKILTMFKIGSVLSDVATFQSIRLIFESLPTPHQEALAIFLDISRAIIGQSKVNKMSPNALSIVLGPSLLSPDDIGIELAQVRVDTEVFNSFIEFLLNNVNEFVYDEGSFPEPLLKKNPPSVLMRTPSLQDPSTRPPVHSPPKSTSQRAPPDSRMPAVSHADLKQGLAGLKPGAVNGRGSKLRGPNTAILPPTTR